MVLNAGLRSCFVDYWRQSHITLNKTYATLYHLNPYIIIRLIVRPYRTVKCCIHKTSFVDIPQEIPRSDRRFLDVDLYGDIAKISLDQNHGVDFLSAITVGKDNYDISNNQCISLNKHDIS